MDLGELKGAGPISASSTRPSKSSKHLERVLVGPSKTDLKHSETPKPQEVQYLEDWSH